MNLHGNVETFDLGAWKLIDGSKLDRGLELREMKAENVAGGVFRWGCQRICACQVGEWAAP